MRQILLVIYISIGIISCFLLQAYFSPVISSAIIGLIDGVISKQSKIKNEFKSKGLMYCGSFIAMAEVGSDLLIYYIVLSSITGAIVYFLCRDLFVGFGGKLGSIAFLVSLFSFILLGPL